MLAGHFARDRCRYYFGKLKCCLPFFCGAGQPQPSGPSESSCLGGEQWPAVYKQGNYGLMALPGAPVLRNLRVVVAEVQPHAEYHLDILTTVWQQWLQESKLPKPELLPRATDLLTAREAVGRLL